MKPETKLMSAILGTWFEDNELHREVDGLSLKEALLGQIEAVEQDLRSGGPAFRTRCRRLVMLRFGFEDGHGRLLREIALEFGVTGERIRQMEAKLLRLLRHGKRSRVLEPFIKKGVGYGA